MSVSEIQTIALLSQSVNSLTSLLTEKCNEIEELKKIISELKRENETLKCVNIETNVEAEEEPIIETVVEETTAEDPTVEGEQGVTAPKTEQQTQRRQSVSCVQKYTAIPIGKMLKYKYKNQSLFIKKTDEDAWTWCNEFGETDTTNTDIATFTNELAEKTLRSRMCEINNDWRNKYSDSHCGGDVWSFMYFYDPINPQLAKKTTLHTQKYSNFYSAVNAFYRIDNGDEF